MSSSTMILYLHLRLIHTAVKICIKVSVLRWREGAPADCTHSAPDSIMFYGYCPEIHNDVFNEDASKGE